MSVELNKIPGIQLKISELVKEVDKPETDVSKFHLQINGLREKINTLNYDNEIFDIRE
jgi:peptidoglycan hydrolase CwlO-like protein